LTKKRSNWGVVTPSAAATLNIRVSSSRYHESLSNLTPADVYFGRGASILEEWRPIKEQPIQSRRLQHQIETVQTLKPMSQSLLGEINPSVSNHLKADTFAHGGV
jgi:hypothetical protein